ncbi:hypothetical protein IscW_ISCW010592 [Ixodes scapularis]|uniref:Peptidase M13 N-terminal domain-containing protein n=1 Tax=Ixodes scapularis TaxID=6945 RepID=B7Q6T4_IXOSC|nr:hypothetical protein IscW_ISCW010592 [Ixodes scapularis]|eukprot:XP_002403389.1 hypothetical protein IscW_ISCW010592 [Ixodes scapularis]
MTNRGVAATTDCSATHMTFPGQNVLNSWQSSELPRIKAKRALGFLQRVPDALRHFAFSCLGVVLTTGLIVTSLVLLRFSGAIGTHRSASSWDACDSKLCLTHVRRLRESLDKEARPCDNFYTFACGSWRPRLPGALTALRDMLAVDRMDVLRHLQPGNTKPGDKTKQKCMELLQKLEETVYGSIYEFLQLNDEEKESPEVWKLNIVNQYEKEPNGLSDVTLAEFVAWYTQVLTGVCK